MTIAVWANDEQWHEITACSTAVEWKRMEAANLFIEGTDASFILDSTNTLFNASAYKNPIFLNTVDNTLKEINLPGQIIRINGWASFLKSHHWEIAGTVTDKVNDVMLALNKKITIVPDTAGLVSARIIAMIINEAYFALGEDVSSKDEIDTAMKLGTNYPYGPFEWSAIIGVKNIFSLLKKLSREDKRYLPAPLLEKEATA